MTERRRIDFEIEVPATPEQVWEAIATGPGIGAWFVPSEVAGHVGGDVVFHLGPGMDAPGTITGWEPPSRFAYEEQDADGKTLGTEFLVEARAGGTCVVRLVSTFSAGYSDEEIEGMGSGWTAFVDNLRIYLTHFGGQPPAAMSVIGTSPDPADATWQRLRAALEADDAPALDGVVERERDDDLLVRAPDGFFNLGVFSWGPTTVTTVRRSCFGPDAEAVAARAEADWSAWMARHFPAAAA
jgi:uncharacterized protein YndB with AHSA1/START domain